MIRVLVIFGTRPEAIKLAPVIQALKADARFVVTVCSTAQHREMLQQVLQVFDLRADVDLDVMKPGQDLAHITGRVLERFSTWLPKLAPDWLLVQGDTTTAFSAALAGFYHRVAVGHVEAGLRTHDKYAPFPEEMNRRLVSVMADAHFAPTSAARDHLLRENIPAARIWVTGNTGLDALHQVVRRLGEDAVLAQRAASALPFLDPKRRLVLVTAHRRESFGGAFEHICLALRDVARARQDVQFVYPVHLNPQVREPVERILGRVGATGSTADPNGAVYLVEPMDYLSLAWLLHRAHFVVTDSGGIQEEAASLGRPVLVLREVTERPEGVEAGVAVTVGTDREKIFNTIYRLLDDATAYARMAQPTTAYGDGQAAGRIVSALAELGVGI